MPCPKRYTASGNRGRTKTRNDPPRRRGAVAPGQGHVPCPWPVPAILMTTGLTAWRRTVQLGRRPGRRRTRHPSAPPCGDDDGRRRRCHTEPPGGARPRAYGPGTPWPARRGWPGSLALKLRDECPKIGVVLGMLAFPPEMAGRFMQSRELGGGHCDGHVRAGARRGVCVHAPIMHTTSRETQAPKRGAGRGRLSTRLPIRDEVCIMET